MYDVASRTIVIRTTTGKNVGPSTYIVCNPKSKIQNRAAFLSTKSRAPSFIRKFYTEALYDVRGSGNKIRGGSSLKNKSQRFVYKEDDGSSGPRLSDIPKPRWIKKKLVLDPNKPKLYVCRVPYTIKDSAPSIPTHVDENGYDIDSEGNIIKVPPDDLVPEEGKLLREFPSNRGWYWACRTSQRFNPRAHFSDGPGPAAYTLQPPENPQKLADEEFREMARRFSFVPRFLEAQEIKAQRNKGPGPGSYDIQGSNFADRSKSINPRPFVRGAPRFPDSKFESPAPNQYDVPLISKKQTLFSMSNAPFNVESPRFRWKEQEDSPGPASYCIKGALMEKIMSKRNPYATFEPPFNKTAKRDLNFAKRDAACTPSAADYPSIEDEKDEEDNILEASASVFLSAVNRFTPDCKKADLGPASYDVAPSYKRMQNRKSFHFGTVPFNSSGPRSTTPSVRFGVPCPTTYQHKSTLAPSGYHFNVTPRFKEAEESPGPGDYMVHPSFEMSIYKAIDTHNLRLKENVLKKKLRQAPSQTRKQWMATFKKKKMLHWFHKDPDYEEQQMLLIQKLFENPV